MSQNISLISPNLLVNTEKNCYEESLLKYCVSNINFRLCESKTTSMDGTFKICPKIFYQLYVIHSRLTHGSVPELFCLLPDKKGSTYLRLVNLLKAKAIGMNLTFEPKTVIMDFEFAVHNVVRDLMPSTHLKGCPFHFGQALFRNLQRLGLSPAYMSSEEVRKWLRMFVGLSFLPVPRVVDGYDLVMTHTLDLLACFQFNEYFHETCINVNFPLSIWNHFRSDTPRTKNNCEGYNSRLTKRPVN